jgi:hypothetical protein
MRTDGGTEGEHVKFSSVVFMIELGNGHTRNTNEINK